MVFKTISLFIVLVSSWMLLTTISKVFNSFLASPEEILNKALNGSDLPVNKLLEMREKTVIITDQDI